MLADGSRFAAHQFLDAMAACSTLELALRFMCPPDMTKWHLHEQTTEAGMLGRTYSTGRLFDEQGRMVAGKSTTRLLSAREADEVLERYSNDADGHHERISRRQ